MLSAQQRNLLDCRDCGLRHRMPTPLAEGLYRCQRCGADLHHERHGWHARALAFTLTGVILFLVSNLFPFLGLEVGGLRQETTLLSGVQALFEREQTLLAVLVLGTIFLMPLLELLGLSYLLGSFALRCHLPLQRGVLYLLLRLRPWNMMEVFLVGALVASIKLQDMADILPGPALFAFLGVVFMLIAAHSHVDRLALWRWIRAEDAYLQQPGEAMISCDCCQALVGSSLSGQPCPRCGSRLSGRVTHSLQKTTALLLGAVILYVPANTLPIMTTTSLGQVQTDTIFSGVLYLLQSGMWPLALIVFVASILVPLAKIVVLSYLLWSVHWRSAGRLRHRAWLYRITEFVGRWSMIDVYVVILLVALVQFGLLANIEPGGAALAFGGVVILTMLAAETFDPRLLWDVSDDRSTR